ncbi:Fe-S cluster assembly protein SufD [Lactiplantibacillus modestisalitolerans]|uniref:Fe-S cluster assembly protein SufD n=1 Tax=Lactiplantibacillus modestisalitolerans TaxID=1457219 RepID=A0ABV5WT91_9LACO|nr:Fe-S cluster assembly protein SufD [Lactiplantibacillus modestisalitolerans]
MTISNAPSWFQALQERARQLYPTLALPDFKRFNYRDWQLDDPAMQPPAALTPLASDDQHFNQQAITYGSAPLQVNLTAEMRDAGVVVEDFATAFTKHGDLLQQYLMTKAVAVDEDRLTAFNLANLQHGLLVYVPENVQLTTPLQLLHLQNSTTASSDFGHVLIVAGRHSQVKVLQQLETRGTHANQFHLITEVVALANSHVTFTGLDMLSQQTTAYLNRRGYLGTDARIDWSIGVFNNGNTIADFDSDLRGHGSDAEVKVVALSGGDQRQCIDTRVTNYAPHSTGNIAQRGVILGRSELIFNGIGKIIKGAHGAHADQENRVLMLSDQAHGDANPILLIDENDVLAGHAASVGRVDEHQMYYLMSRGIPKKMAQRLVIRGFLGDVLSQLPSEELRERMVQVIEGKLKNELAD